MIVGGERKSTLTPEEYIAGAIMLYLDIVNIFIHILYILLGLSNDWKVRGRPQNILTEKNN